MRARGLCGLVEFEEEGGRTKDGAKLARRAHEAASLVAAKGVRGRGWRKDVHDL